MSQPQATIGSLPGLTVWQWNCHSYNKRAVLQQHITTVTKKPDIILLQETATATPTLPWYHAHVSPAEGRGFCTFVRKGLMFIEHQLKHGRSRVEYTFTEILPSKQRIRRLVIANIYSNSKHHTQKFNTLLHTASTQAKKNTLLIGGDFNAAHRAWGYVKDTAKGRDLLQDALDHNCALITDPAHPTHIGNFVARDTTPDLTFIQNDHAEKVTWHNSGVDLGSDHYILEITVPNLFRGNTIAHKWTDWDGFHKGRPTTAQDITDIATSTAELRDAVQSATKTIETDEDVVAMDSRLAHFIEAKCSIQARWKRQRLNRKLRMKVADLNRDIIRHLLDKTKTKSHQRDRLARLMHTTTQHQGKDAVIKSLEAKYLPDTPTKTHPPYGRLPNAWLDRDITTSEVRVALHELNTRSAAGLDLVTNKILCNLDDASIESLTRYFNECWRSGKLPRQWKTARTILISKPGKPPDIGNLCPISLTSCVDKVLEHVVATRW
ncbi:uncharacterized protein LOC144150959 [Haemaphysalis longicornis]